MDRRLTLLAASAAALALVPGTALAAPGGPEPTPGAPGIGDPYYPLDGNGGYDVERYDLDLRYDPATDLLSGVAGLTSQATQALSSFHLDLEGLTVESVEVDRRPATWTRDGGELVVTPAQPLREGEDFTTVVTYSGVPATLPDGSGFFHTDDGALVVGQPDVAATWFPANDHPSDAASVDVSVTVPEGLEGISNGELVDEETEDGWTTWEWEAEEPMATYLVTLAVGEFDVRSYEADGIEYWDALDPDLFGLPTTETGPSVGAVAEGALGRQPEVIGFLSDWFGPYPFEEAGGIVDDIAELGFALETQTRPVYAPGFFYEPTGGASVVVHELAHQWTGDSVRLARWTDIWLNEGFATYAEWLWQEREGLTTVQQQFDAYAATPPGEELWTITPGDPGPALETLFSSSVYDRGAMTLHALRVQVGDEVFREILRTWAGGSAGEAVTTADFVALAEEESGQELDALFQTWLYTPEKPAELG